MKNGTVLSTLDLVRHLDSTTQVPQVLKFYGPWFPYMQSDDNKTYRASFTGLFFIPSDDSILCSNHTSCQAPLESVFRISLSSSLLKFLFPMKHLLPSTRCQLLGISFLSLFGVSPYHMFQHHWTLHVVTDRSVSVAFLSHSVALFFTQSLEDLFGQRENRWYEA